jgi:prepilin-type N-terminal cleavage/methylation domain-containing protein
MPIFTSKKSNETTVSFTKNQKTHQRGFSLIEILVGLGLMTVVFMIVSSVNFTSRQSLDEVLDNIERAMRYSVNEAALKNVMIRLHFNMEKDTHTYSVEYGPDGDFVLPVSPYTAKSDLSIKEMEKFRKQTENLNRKFNRVREFQDKAREFPYGIKLLGMGSSIEKRLVRDYHAAVYISPTGEKDSVIIIVGSEDEVVGLTIDPFSLEMQREYRALPEGDSDDLADRQDSVAKEMYEEWLKK